MTGNRACVLDGGAEKAWRTAIHVAEGDASETLLSGDIPQRRGMLRISVRRVGREWLVAIDLSYTVC